MWSEVSFAKPKSVNLRTVFFSLDVYSRFSGWRGDTDEKTSERVRRAREAAPSSRHLDVSVGDVDAVEVVDGRADVPHDLRSLWEGKRGEKKTLSNRQQRLETGLVKEHRLPPSPASRDAFRVRPGLTFLSEGLVALRLDATEQLSSLHAGTRGNKEETACLACLDSTRRRRRPLKVRPTTPSQSAGISSRGTCSRTS